MQQLRQLWQWLGSNHEPVKIAFAVVAGLYVLVQYQLAQTDATIARTMELQARYGQGDILAARVKLESYWLNPESEADLAKTIGTKNEKITTVILGRKLDGSVFVLVDFFSQVVTCLQSGLCHTRTACTVFKRDVDGLRNTYFDLFQRWEKRWGENLAETAFQYFGKACASG